MAGAWAHGLSLLVTLGRGARLLGLIAPQVAVDGRELLGRQFGVIRPTWRPGTKFGHPLAVRLETTRRFFKPRQFFGRLAPQPSVLGGDGLIIIVVVVVGEVGIRAGVRVVVARQWSNPIRDGDCGNAGVCRGSGYRVASRIAGQAS
jgi:hypothetical protein